MPPRLFAPPNDLSGHVSEPNTGDVPSTLSAASRNGDVHMTRGTDEPGASLAGRAILIAEDNAIIAMDLQMMLEDRGATVVGPWSTVDDALEAIGEGGIDLALLDVDLKGADSLPAMAALAERQVPIVLITGHDVAKRLPPAFASLPVVGKPFTDAAIVAALEAALDAARGAREE